MRSPWIEAIHLFPGKELTLQNLELICGCFKFIYKTGRRKDILSEIKEASSDKDRLAVIKKYTPVESKTSEPDQIKKPIQQLTTEQVRQKLANNYTSQLKTVLLVALYAEKWNKDDLKLITDFVSDNINDPKKIDSCITQITALNQKDRTPDKFKELINSLGKP